MRERTMVLTPYVQQDSVSEKRKISDDSLVWTKSSSYTNTHYKNMSDVVTSNFQARMNKGEIINSPMSSIVEHMQATPGEFNSRSESGDYYVTGERFMDLTSWPGYLELSHVMDNDKDLAIAKAWANVSESKADVLVTAAEGRKSIDGIIDILKRLRRIMKAVKRLQFQRLRKELAPHEIMDRWLEIRYGLRPLIYDAKAIVAAVEHNTAVKGSRQTFRGVQLWSDSENDVVESTWATSYYSNITRATSMVTSARAGVLCELERISEADVWGIYDVPQAILDLTTFSFVVGWFFNLADFVASWTPSASWKALTSWVVAEKTKTRSMSNGSVTRNSGDVTGGFNGGSYTHTTITVNRDPDPSRPLMPRFSVNLDAYKLIDLVALSRIFWRSIPNVRR